MAVTGDELVGTGRPGNVDLRSLFSGESPLDLFEIDTTDPENPKLKLKSGYMFQYMESLIAAIQALSERALLAPSEGLAPSLSLAPSIDPPIIDV